MFVNQLTDFYVLEVRTRLPIIRIRVLVQDCLGEFVVVVVFNDFKIKFTAYELHLQFEFVFNYHVCERFAEVTFNALHHFSHVITFYAVLAFEECRSPSLVIPERLDLFEVDDCFIFRLCPFREVKDVLSSPDELRSLLT